MKVVLFICSLGLLANENLVAAELPTESSGWETVQWLELQRSGAVASSKPQPVSGDAAANIYQRYLKSFKYPIPEYFLKNDINSGGGSSSSSSN